MPFEPANRSLSGLGGMPEQHAENVLRLLQSGRQLWDGRLGRGQHRLRLLDVPLRGGAALKARSWAMLSACRCTSTLSRAICRRLERADLHVIGGDIAGERHQDVVIAGDGAEQGRVRRLNGAAEPAPKSSSQAACRPN